MALVTTEPKVSRRVSLSNDARYTLGSVDPDASADNILLTLQAINALQANYAQDIIKQVKTTFYDAGQGV